MRTIKNKYNLKGGDKNNRWTRKKKFYDSIKKTSCGNITDISSVENRLTKNFIQKYNLDKNYINNFKFYLFPFCSEKNKLEKVESIESIDKVNSSQIELKLLDTLNEVFDYSYNYHLTNFTLKKGIIKPTMNLEISERIKKFNKYISSYDFNNKNGAFIISHSKFMSEFIKHVKKLIPPYDIYDNKEYSFDNYDILELIYIPEQQKGKNINIGKNRLYSIKIRRYDKNYEEEIIKDYQEIKKTYAEIYNKYSYTIKSPQEKDQDKDKDKDKKNLSKNEDILDLSKKKHLFLMRHCLGCHNITPGIKDKSLQAFRNENGFLKYSMCLEDAFCMLSEKREFIIDLLHESCNSSDIKLDKNDPNYINNLLDQYQFGSSIIYRAILTSILLVFSLLKTRDESILKSCNNIDKTVLSIPGKFEVLEI